MIFWDASAIVPLVIPESTSNAAEALLGADIGIVVWWGTPVECESALSRGERAGVLTSRDAESARASLALLRNGWTEIQPSDVVRERAVVYLRAYPLRAADALQLAAGSVWADGRRGEQLATLDARLGEAARAEGFEVPLTAAAT